MRGGGRPFGGPPLPGFEGLFVAGIGGSHPLGTLERREERREEEEEELDRVSGRKSPVRARLCLLTWDRGYGATPRDPPRVG